MDLAIGLKVKQIGLKLAHKHQMSPKICFRCLGKKEQRNALLWLPIRTSIFISRLLVRMAGVLKNTPYTESNDLTYLKYAVKNCSYIRIGDAGSHNSNRLLADAGG